MKPTWVVCIKQVPKEPVFKRTGDSFQIDRDRTEGILNPHDRHALECARDLKEQAGGSMIALSMGPPTADEALQEARAHGVDEAILLSDPAFAGADTLATAHTLAAAVRKIGAFTLILCGARTLDSDTAQVGPQLAELLDLPMAASVTSVTYRRNAIRVERRIDGMREKIQLPLPALITVERARKGADPASLRALEESFTGQAVTRWGEEDLDVDPSCIGWKGSATVAKEYAAWKHERAGEIVNEKATDAVKRILRVLEEHNILGR